MAADRWIARCAAACTVGWACFGGPAARGVTLPTVNLSNSQGSYEGVYFVIRDVNAAPLSAARIAQIEESSVKTREFYAANSGGTYDLRYAHILDVPLTLDSNGRRIGDWIADAENYVRSQYGIEPESYHANLFDVSGTTPDEGQGWSGLAWIPSNNYAVQPDITSNWGQIVADHELGHRIGAPHAGAWRSINDANYTPYVYDYDAGAYVEYNQSVHGYQSTPLGVHRDEYGNPFDVMGNISHGHFNVHEKLNSLHWLTEDQVADPNELEEGVYRIYAHDDQQAYYSRRDDTYGVQDGYHADLLYGLTYDRRVVEYNNSRNRFGYSFQNVTLEYRTGKDGLQFYLDGAVLDLDPEGGLDRNNGERELEVGQTIREIDFGTAFYQGEEGVDFAALSSPPPQRPWEVMSSWLEFAVLGTGADSIGSYVELAIGTANYAVETGVFADLNIDGLLDRADWDIFTANSGVDLDTLTYTNRYLHGDLDFDGDNDYRDFLLFKLSYLELNGAAAFASMLAVPEPGAGAGLLILLWLGQRHRLRRPEGDAAIAGETLENVGSLG
ncbi:hypothetical protein Pla123a_24510 [Posidoniimonas polymericola]|uniref:Uncharacterized protein n=1 Tax=Posidoniimonas polymericola TaxID=2528002 RepID=A0A5C5YQ74_9BACT|nr:hypothetical protein [Posidoniimonas polymericola]TWT77023.1 hypothetical protein Pla123a_24510 [Posidoniimonas polymericola]